MGFIRQVQLPAGATTIVSAARCFIRHVVIATNGGGVGGTVSIRPLHITTALLQMLAPPGTVTGDGRAVRHDLTGFYAPDGFRVQMPANVSGSVVFEEEPTAQAPMVLATITLNTVRQLLGLSTPHPLHGLKKWGTFPTETATDATWDADVDTENFYYRVPRGYTKEKKWPLLVGHHQLKNDPSTVTSETTLDEKCSEWGYLYVSPTSLLSDTWPNVLSRECLDAVITYMIQNFNADPDDINIVGFSLGGQQASSFAALHRDPDKIMARTACSVAPDWEQLVWQRKQHSNTNLGQSVVGTLCDPNPGTPTSSLWRSQQQRADQMGGPWPGADGVSVIGKEWRASAILALDPASYAETGPMTSLNPILPQPSAADIPAAVIDFDRSIGASGLWTPHLIWWGEDDALIIIPPLTLKLIDYYDAVNPVAGGTAAIQQDPVRGPLGWKPEIHNVGIWGGPGAHVWAILDVDYYFEWMRRQPRLDRLPPDFEYVAYPAGASKASFIELTNSSAVDLARIRVFTVVTPGGEGWTMNTERRVGQLVIDMARTKHAPFNFGVGAPVHLNTTTNYPLIIKNMPHLPAGATGTNVGVVTIPDPVAGGNSIRIAPAGAGAMAVEVT